MEKRSINCIYLILNGQQKGQLNDNLFLYEPTHAPTSYLETLLHGRRPPLLKIWWMDLCDGAYLYDGTKTVEFPPSEIHLPLFLLVFKLLKA